MEGITHDGQKFGPFGAVSPCKGRRSAMYNKYKGLMVEAVVNKLISYKIIKQELYSIRQKPYGVVSFVVRIYLACHIRTLQWKKTTLSPPPS